ncbi:THO complex subunit 5 [Skeletonema marinoi]|uniref:THO complex subunit 5 n=1 Tax=Skeletonema marinoi TaxID=267567 RepID=A0AAD8YC00_9STRA|nr:THO complex subunit 5 [Skeletonema marinoi]
MPPAKKRRVAAAAAAAELADSTIITTNDNSSLINNKLLQQHRQALDTLLQTVDQLSSNIASENNNKVDDDNLSESILTSSLALANLKSLQRQIALQVETQANESKEQRAKVEECSLMLENLTYERNYLQREIGSLEGWKADELEKMAWAELGQSNNESRESGEEDVVMGDATSTGDNTNNIITTAEDAINTYLLRTNTNNNTNNNNNNVVDHRNPTNHTKILQKLQSDIQTRSTLVTQLSQSKLKLTELQKKRDELSGFLTRQIPKKLDELEKGAESLNSFFGLHGVWSDVLRVEKRSGMEKDDDDNADDDLNKKKVETANMLINRPSFDRSRRFQLAKSNLSSPLYVLYVQLAGYKDAWASLDKVGECDDGNTSNVLGGYLGASGMDVTIEKATESDWRVVLSLSISGIIPLEVASTFGKAAGSTNSRSASPTPGQSLLSVVFSYDNEDGVVYASVDADGSKDVGEGLLDSLFPDDDGSTLPNVSLSLLKDEEDEDEAESDEGESSNVAMDNTAEEKSTENKKGKAYYWCQVLSGLNFPPPSIETDVVTDKAEKDTPFQIQICTKAVMRQLLRRIRARQTLSSMVVFLGRRGQLANPIPIHPKMKRDNASSNAPTLKAKLQSWSKEEDMKRYVATIKRKSATLKASVTISDNYPAEPPVWSLQSEDGSVGAASSLQSNNDNSKTDVLFDASLHRIECHVNQDLDKFVCEDVEATYDWILIHQLADIVSCWDEMMSAKEEGNANKSKGHERIRKGKDRKLVGFGEKSPFFLYRNGL